mgnify:CR=1 FL=1
MYETHTYAKAYQQLTKCGCVATKLVVLNKDEDTVSFVGTSDGRTIKQIETPYNPHEVLVVPHENKTYVSCSLGNEVVVIDKEDAPGVEVAGDATQRETMEAAGIDDARAVVIALDSDTTTIFATLAVRQVAPHAEVIARANDAESVRKLYRAGADYVLSLSTVSGRLLASHLLDEEVLRPETQVDLLRTTAPRLEGKTLAGSDVRAETGVTVVAVERNGDLLTDVGPDTRVIDGDRLVVAGTDDAVNRFNEQFA